MRNLALLAVLAGCDSASHAVPPDATPDAPPLPPGVTAVPLTGCGPFFSGALEIGGSPYRLTIDTGSSTFGVAAAGCTTCSSAGVSPLYTPGPSAVDQHQTATQKYGDGQMWSGEIYQDAVQAGPGVNANVDLVAITTQSNFFAPDECGMPQGIVGMGPAGGLLPGTSSFMTGLAAGGVADQFAMHYCETTGTLWLGGYDPAAASGTPTFVPMQSGYGYTINLVDILVDGAPTAQPGTVYGAAIVDSGGPSLIVSPAAHDAIAAKIAASPVFQAHFGDATFFANANASHCVPSTLSRAQLDAQLPVFSVKLGDGSVVLSLPATSSYLEVYEEAGHRVYCPALFGLPGFSDLGNSLIRSYVTIFDRAHAQMGFAAASGCT